MKRSTGMFLLLERVKFCYVLNCLLEVSGGTLFKRGTLISGRALRGRIFGFLAKMSY